MKVTQLKPTLIALLFFSFSSNAQLRFPVTNNDLRNNLSSVITGYVDGFSSLKGDTISINPQSIEYSARIDFVGAQQNSIHQYGSAPPVYSWQAVLTSTEDFEEASKKYKWLFNQLKVMTVKVQDYAFTLTGDYDAPEESRRFATSIFKLTPNASNMPRLKIEASMQFEFPEWKVSLAVYEKEREDHERGDINGE